MWITTTAVMFSSAAGFVGLMVWMAFLMGASRVTLPASPAGSASPVTAIDAATLPAKRVARRKAKCPECGFVESIREVEAHGEAIPPVAARRPMAENRNPTPVRSAGRTITVRLEDGSSRVIVDTNPGTWRRGERVIVIDGVVGQGA
jgi:hypothetical protein